MLPKAAMAVSLVQQVVAQSDVPGDLKATVGAAVGDSIALPSTQSDEAEGQPNQLYLVARIDHGW